MQLSRIDFNLLATLDALLEEGSVSRAARRVGLSTPAMSHALARLRRQVEDPILVRAGRSMVLTARAVELKPRVRALVSEARTLMAPSGAFDPARLRRRFRLHATDHVVTVLGPTLDRLVAAEAPGVSFQILPNLVDDADHLRAGTIDLAIGVYPSLPPELRTRRLFADRFVCVVRAGHPRAGDRITLEEYTALDHVQIVPRGLPGGYVDDRLAALGLRRNVVRAVPYFLAGLMLVAETDYVLTISTRVAHAVANQLRLKIMEPPLALEPYTLVQIWHPRLDGDPAHRWLREMTVRAAETAAPDPA